MQKIPEKEAIKIYRQYTKLVNRFQAKYNSNFAFSLKVIEESAIIFDEIELENIEQLTEEFYNFNEFFFSKLCKELNLYNKYKVIIEFYNVYQYAIALCNIFSSNVHLCELKFNKPEPLTPDESKRLKYEEKYKRKMQADYKGKINHYFFENFNFKIFIVDQLLFFDNIRKVLTENGDYLNLINKRDYILTIAKYYEIISKGLS